MSEIVPMSLAKDPLSIELMQAASIQGKAARPLIASMLETNQCTPDMARLNGYNGHLVFTYGTLQRGHVRNHTLASKGQFISEAVTTSEFTFWETQGRMLERFPVMMYDTNNSLYAGYVRGEVWWVSTDTIRDMDAIESNGYMYHRVPVGIQFTSKPTDKEYQYLSQHYAYAYIGSQAYWCEMLRLGAIKTVGRPNARKEKKQFLYFTKEA